MREDFIYRNLEIAKSRAEAAEVIQVNSETTSVQFKAGRLATVETKYESGVGLRVIVDGRIGFSSTTDDSKAEELVGNAVSSARFGQAARFELPGSVEWAHNDKSSPASGVDDLKLVDEHVLNFTLQKAVEEGRKAIELIKEARPEVLTDILIGKTRKQVRIVNTSGLDRSYEKTVFRYYIMGMVVNDQGFLLVEEGRTSGKLRLETEGYVGSLVRKVKLADAVAEVKTGRMPVIFVPEVLADLLEALEIGTNGKMVQKGSSPLANRIGEPLLDKRLTIVDDGRIDYGVGSAPFDGEGVPTGRTVLFENGVLRGYLFDLQTAGIMGCRPTGNGGRGFDSLPTPETTNLVIHPDKTPLEEMIGSLESGLIVYQALGGGQSNLMAGDFSLNVHLGYRIEKGMITGRVKDTMISGNIYHLLKDLVAVGDRCEEIGNLQVPPLCLPDVSVASGI
ncbi:MAG TPA: TldD/PmbA family protein [Candidatus Latescibacteria bacterium]|nr:TldD/PmbA family protein [Candidatus Latescibacterota bacterium]